MDDEGLGDGACDGRLSRAELEQAWQDTLAADAADGTVSSSVVQFADDAAVRLDELSAELMAGSWRPGALGYVAIPKRGGTRELHVPSVRDRIVERALLRRLTAVFDPLLSPTCFAYRPGLGVVDAVNAVGLIRDEGLRWVVRADIDDCFPSVDRNLLREAVMPRTPRQLWPIVDLLLERPVSRRGRSLRVPRRGVPQGSPLSPLLVNVLLARVDERVASRGFPSVRYADDIVVAADSQEGASDALAVLRAALWEVRMKLDDDKTSVMSFEDGFAFLGEDFGPRYPQSNPMFRVEAPDRRSLYVSRPGCHVAVREGQIRVTHDDADLLSVPTGHVERIVVFGPVGLSAGARAWAATNGVEVVFCSQRGGYLGQLIAGTPQRVTRRLAQYALRADGVRRMAVAREIVDAKVAKQQTLLRRFSRVDTADDVAACVGQLQRLRSMIPDADSPPELMGIEGAAAAAYFGCWPILLPDGVAFAGRSRRPPRDVVNAALSLGYTMLHGEATGAVVAAGLDPEVGFLTSRRIVSSPLRTTLSRNSGRLLSTTWY